MAPPISDSSSASVLLLSAINCSMRFSFSSISLPFFVEVEVALAGSLPRRREQGHWFKPLHESVVHDRDGMEEDVRRALAVREFQNQLFHGVDAGLGFRHHKHKEVGDAPGV